MHKARLKVITSNKEYRAAVQAIEELWDAKPGSRAHDELEVLALLTDDYERRSFPMAEPDPVAAIRFRMEQAGMEPKDLIPLLGSKSRVSEVLNGKRGLTTEMVRRLFDVLHIPMEALIPRTDGAR